jgi:predicted rRNA methylase YqxC with S4 and FtsJ domains
MSDAHTTFLTTRELAARHREAEQTIRAKRVRGDGPPFVKVSGKVLYRLSDVLEHERQNTFASTAQANLTAAVR